jgi:peroxiredoxin
VIKKILITVFFFVNFQIHNIDTRGFKVKIGDPVPNFEFELLDGRKISINDMKGNVILIQFTASWCGVCRKEMPELETRIWQKFKNEDFFMVAFDYMEDTTTTKKFIKETQITYPVSIDSEGEIFNLFSAPNQGVTRNILINKKGEIYFLTRLFDPDEFNEMILKIQTELQS